MHGHWVSVARLCADGQPIMVIFAPAAISALTGQNLTLAARTNLDQIARRDTN